MTVSIVNTDHYVLTVTIDALSYVISKPTIFLASDEPYLYFNWSQFNKNKLVQNQFVIDFNDVTAPVCVSAADLLTQVQAFIYSPLTGGVTSVSATSPITSSGGATPVISTSMNTNRIIGRYALGGGVMQEISIGTNVSIAGGTLNVTIPQSYNDNFLLMGA